MNGTIAVAIITVVGSIIAVAITLYMAKAKGREAGSRAVKLTHYKPFMAALSATACPTPTPRSCGYDPMIEERCNFQSRWSAS